VNAHPEEPVNGAAGRIEALERLLVSRDKTIAALVKRARERQADVSTAFGAGQAAVALQATVERKTAELWAANTRLEDEIAERKRSEQLRQQLESSLADSQRLEAIGRLAAGVAHEINTPTQYVGDNIQFLAQNLGPMLEVLEAVPAILAGRADDDGGVRDVLAQLERIDIGFLKEEVPAALSQSQDGVARIACIVRAMKEFSHPGTKEFVDFDLNHALQSTLTVGRSEWKYIAQVELDLDPNLPKVPCLPGEINQVLLNVLVNASHAVKSRMQVERERPGVIRIGTRVRAGHVEVAISDNGCGIPKEHFKRIFEPFFTTKPVGTGTGQGLAMAWSVVVGKHGGAIDVTSEVGVGTTFVLRIPTSRPEAPLPAPADGACR
jgi:two-component system NtrC family sensor kinase